MQENPRAATTTMQDLLNPTQKQNENHEPKAFSNICIYFHSRYEEQFDLVLHSHLVSIATSSR